MSRVQDVLDKKTKLKERKANQNNDKYRDMEIITKSIDRTVERMADHFENMDEADKAFEKRAALASMYGINIGDRSND